MPVLTLENACLAFGHVALLDHTELQIDAGERVALIGRNGGGKSSLLRVLAGGAQLDDGRLWRQTGLKISSVPQEPSFDDGAKVFDVVAQGAGEASALLVGYHDITRRMADDHSAELMEQFHDVQARLEAADGWRLTMRVEQALNKLELDGEALVGTLSGGNLKRLALAQALAGEPELLLLDEPTNHLDLDGILKLEQFIVAFAGAVIVVTHDRRFLDRVATRVVELDRGRLTSFPGDFQTYLRRKAEMLEVEEQQGAKFDKVLAQEEAWIRQGVKARRARNEGRVRRLEQLRRERAARRNRVGTVRMQVARGDTSGKLVAELERVRKCFGERVVVRDFSCRIQRGDKIGFIGPNGAGKTTLLKLILGQLPPDSGSVRLGTKLTVAYFDQFRAALDEEAVLIDVINPGSDFIEIGGERKHVISYLGDFLFPPERARAPVKSLSGGERNRLLLARLFSQPANLIVLDEPTNDLDIETLELLETLLQDFDGTVFLVSHDRSFLDSVVTQVIASEGDGAWREYVGGFDDWQRQRQNTNTTAPNKEPPLQPAEKTKRPVTPSRPTLSSKETRELAALPARISALEAEQAGLSLKLSDPAIYNGDLQEAVRLAARLSELEKEMTQAMARWEELEQRTAQMS